jgi:hypothetical protein
MTELPKETEAGTPGPTGPTPSPPDTTASVVVDLPELVDQCLKRPSAVGYRHCIIERRSY